MGLFPNFNVFKKFFFGLITFNYEDYKKLECETENVYSYQKFKSVTYTAFICNTFRKEIYFCFVLDEFQTFELSRN